MKKALSVFVFIFYVGTLLAQSSKDFKYSDQEEAEYLIPGDEKITQKNKTNFQLITGTSIGMMSGKNSFVNTFVAPKFSYSLSPNLNINATAMFANTQFHGTSDKSLTNSGTFNNKNFMLGMDYKISEKITIGASLQIHNGINGMNTLGQPFSPFNLMY